MKTIFIKIKNFGKKAIKSYCHGFAEAAIMQYAQYDRRNWK